MRLIDADSIVYREKLECYGHGDFREELVARKEDIDLLPTIRPSSRVKILCVPSAICDEMQSLTPFDMPEEYSRNRQKNICAAKHAVDFERCDDIVQLHNVMDEINRCHYQLISVTQDSNDIYTVFFRRVVFA